MKIEVSNGEIVDKYTILKIKQKRCQDPAKMENITRELEHIESKMFQVRCPEYLVKELYAINEKLWDIEDTLREMENKKEFSARFINLARMVYITNDSRFDIKSKINKVTDSHMVEEKVLPEYNV